MVFDCVPEVDVCGVLQFLKVLSSDWQDLDRLGLPLLVDTRERGKELVFPSLQHAHNIC